MKKLPLRHLFSVCDGGLGTSGPDSFKGPLGRACSNQDLHRLPIRMFKAINTSLPYLEESVQNDLSRDQWLLYKYTKAIATGSVDDNLKHQIAGPLNHSRWLTLAIRLLQLYTRTENPSDALVNIVTYIVKVYSPSWFKIKSKAKFTSSPSNLFYQMRLVMNLPTYI